MAVVLPQGRFNNSSDKQIREFISQHCRILGVVGLHGNVFKPHTGTKTSVMLVQKWDDTLCPKVDDYPIFFATMQERSKDNSGDKLYVTNNYVNIFENGVLVKYSEEDFNNKYGSIDDATRWQHTITGEIINGHQYKEILEKDRATKIPFELSEHRQYSNLMLPIAGSEFALDDHGHLIVKHDLFNHDGLTQDGIAEAFQEFAKKEKLSFFR